MSVAVSLGVSRDEVLGGGLIQLAELKIVLTFWVANLSDHRKVALQIFRMASGLLSYFKTFRVALLPRYPGFCDSGPHTLEQMCLMSVSLVPQKNLSSICHALIC